MNYRDFYGARSDKERKPLHTVGDKLRSKDDECTFTYEEIMKARGGESDAS